MIDGILPAGRVMSAATRVDTPDAFLYPEEARAVANAVERRRLEFGTVRHCARRALAALGLPPSPILPGRRGAPQWPVGVVGSMTHCEGYRAAAVARTADIASLGIDAEVHRPLPEGVLDTIARPEERVRVASALARNPVPAGRAAASPAASPSPQPGDAGPRVHWDTLLFSAKEAVFKTWYPLTGRELDFGEATIAFGLDGTFTARLLVPAPVPVHAGRPLDLFEGRWLVGDGLVLTAITLPAGRPAQ